MAVKTDTARTWPINALGIALVVVETGNESYRFQHSSMAAKSRIKAREQSRKAGKKEEPGEPF
jgi:hypothetical protein